MSKEGIDSLLNLQTLKDMKYRTIDWNTMIKNYDSQSIKALNYQILDMSPDDMNLKAFEAACHLKYL